MRLDVDEPGRQDVALCPDDATCLAWVIWLDRNYATARDCHIRTARRRPRAVDNVAVAYQQIVHCFAFGAASKC
jgi:hypothetical protein